MTLEEWGHYPNNGVIDPFFKGQKQTPGILPNIYPIFSDALLEKVSASSHGRCPGMAISRQ